MKKEKDLDKLFQEASKKAVFNDSAAGWSSMQSKLKGAGVVQSPKNRWFNLNSILIILLFLVVTSGSIWYFYSEESHSNKELALDSSLSANQEDTQRENNSSVTTKDLDSNDSEIISSEDTPLENASAAADLKDSNSSKELTEGGVDKREQQGTENSVDAPKSSLINNEEDADKQLQVQKGLEFVEPDMQDNSLTNEESSADNESFNDELSATASEKFPELEETLKKNDSARKADSSLIRSGSEIRSGSDKSMKSNAYLPIAIENNTDDGIAKYDIGESDNGSSIEEFKETEDGITQQANDIIENKSNPDDQSSNVLYYAGPALLLPIKEIFLVPFLKPQTEIRMVSVEESVSSEEIPTDSIFKRSKWSFGLELSPDLSTVGLRGAEDPGYTVGLHAEYHLSSKLSVSGGVSYSKKIYFADEGLESYPGSNPNWILNRVDANCDVIDIPINLTYYLNGYSESGFLFGAGLSTYFMLTEDYDIIYNSPWPEGSQFFRNENQHFLSILNASVGYRKKLSSVLSLQAEPYIKIPVQGIGAGDLDLYTSGLRLTLKYNRTSARR